MPGFFEALDNFKNKSVKKHFVTIDEQQIEVSLLQKLDILKSGEENYFCQKGPNGEIICKRPVVPKEQQQTQLESSQDGYKFYENNPFWLSNEGTKTYKWKK